MTSRQAWHTSTYIAYLSNNPFELYTAFPYTLTFISMFFFFFLIRQPPAFPCRLQHSIIGLPGLNHRVRDGYGCVPWAHRHRKILLSSFLFLLRPCADRRTLGNASHCLAPGRSPYGFFCPHTVSDAGILPCALTKSAAWTP